MVSVPNADADELEEILNAKTDQKWFVQSDTPVEKRFVSGSCKVNVLYDSDSESWTFEFIDQEDSTLTQKLGPIKGSISRNFKSFCQRF